MDDRTNRKLEVRAAGDAMGGGSLVQMSMLLGTKRSSL